MATKRQPQDASVSQPVEPVPVQPVAPVPPQAYAQAPQPVGMPPQPTQYIVMQQSLKGVGGWLIFWLICFGFAAIGYIYSFFASMLNLSSAPAIVSLIFAPLLAAGYITSIVLIAMQKRLGRLLTWITLGVSAVFSVVNTIVAYVTVSSAARSFDTYYSSYSSYSTSSVVEKSLPLVIATILVSLVVHALIALYFILSKRVKETLVN